MKSGRSGPTFDSGCEVLKARDVDGRYEQDRHLLNVVFARDLDIPDLQASTFE